MGANNSMMQGSGGEVLAPRVRNRIKELRRRKSEKEVLNFDGTVDGGKKSQSCEENEGDSNKGSLNDIQQAERVEKVSKVPLPVSEPGNTKYVNDDDDDIESGRNIGPSSPSFKIYCSESSNIKEEKFPESNDLGDKNQTIGVLQKSPSDDSIDSFVLASAGNSGNSNEGFVIGGDRVKMIDFARVQKELVECSKDSEGSGIKVSPKSDNLVQLIGTIPGPVGTPYEGGTFQIDITLPEGYPFEPPKMQFKNKVWHPNISSQSGAICLDILKDQWSPALTLKTALLSVQALLSAPQPDDPQDAVVAQQYLKDYQTFVNTARYWTESFAKESSRGIEDKVQKLVEMGFAEAQVRNILEAVGGDENLALERLL
ncbi:unnamed protein product [Sphenostylis stenocarpa]|uniref:E2 ubiquitin-conjugating enzyme n=1 Tax=Sphenostylis stenocarpa TaxID=92480 RepID=A0AA86TEA8_9FABA|nr:unnamed protein product [Sphenostylis stenocarpa]